MSPDDLRKSIGLGLDFRGHRYLVVECLDPAGQDAQLVLRSEQRIIQGDQWGEAQRRVPETLSVPVYTETGGVNPELAALWPE